MKTDLEPFLPLSVAAQHILLALSDEDRHGYGIMQEVARQSEGKYKMGSGTLYDNLEKLIDQGLVAESSRRSTKDDPRRRYYRLTAFGRRVFSAEIARMESVVREAKLRLRGARPKEAL
jgi:DNA-binding PadR family transcriptional regulator